MYSPIIHCIRPYAFGLHQQTFLGLQLDLLLIYSSKNIASFHSRNEAYHFCFAYTVGIWIPNTRNLDSSEYRTSLCSEFEHGHDLNSEQVLGTGHPNFEQVLAVLIYFGFQMTCSQRTDHLNTEQVLVRYSDGPFQVLVWHSDVIWILDHFTSEQDLTIQIPNMFGIQIPTV